jgi:hypothetical protein
MVQNFRIEDRKEETYSNSKIVAWKNVYEEYDETKNKLVEKKEFICHLFRNGSKNQPLNLGQCNNGNSFNSVNQAINQAKEIINYLGD